MFSKKPLKTFLFPAVSILLAVFLLRAFFIAGLNVVQTFPVAQMSALVYLQPQPMDYLWEVNIHHALIIKSRMRYYMDYYEHLLQAYPCLRDSYGILGYGYHYLGDDAKAVDYLKKAITYNPLYSWNYYNLAAIYISQSRYQEASHLLNELRFLDPQKSLERVIASQAVYLPLMQAGGQGLIHDVGSHLQLSYRVSLDMLQLINQATYNKKLEGVLKKVKLDLYAF